MTTQKSEFKKKRRSFYEPDSEAIRAWLDNQKDFGRTLQLLAVDAMEKYGNGDAIEGMLHLRTQEPPAVHTPQAPVYVAPTPVQQAPPVQAAPVQPPVTPQAAPVAQPVTPAPPATPGQSAGFDALDGLFNE